MYRAPAGRVHAFVEHAAAGVSVELGSAGPDAPLFVGRSVTLGDPPLPAFAIHARGRERLGSVHRVLVTLDPPDGELRASGDALEVTVNRCASGFARTALRHGDTIEIATARGKPLVVLRIVEDAAPMPPPRKAARDGLALWESSILGQAHGMKRELVVESTGRVALLQHEQNAHPEDAVVLRELKLARDQVRRVGEVIAWARLDDLSGHEWGATRDATLVFYGEGIKRVHLTDASPQGDRDPGADVVLEMVLSLARITADDIASWRPPPLPNRPLQPTHPAPKLLTYTHWTGGERSWGTRFTVFEGGDVVHGDLHMDDRGRESPGAQYESRLSMHHLEIVQGAIDSGLLNGSSAASNPENVSSTYFSLRTAERYDGPAAIRTSAMGHAGGALSDVMDDFDRIARFLERKGR